MVTNNGATRALGVKIIPQFDVSQLTPAQLAILNSQGTTGAQTTTNTANPAQASSGFIAKMQGLLDKFSKLFNRSNQNQNQRNQNNKKTKSSNGKSKKRKVLNLISGSVQLAMKGITKSFGILQELYAKVKQSSQFLQTVEGLFNLAMTLLFLPFGNALATVILPAVIELVDGVLGLWSQMEYAFDGTGGSLGKIITIIMGQGLTIVGEFFKDIGKELQSSGGILGSIGKILEQVGKFIDKGLEPTLNAIFSVISFTSRQFKEFVSLWIGFKVAELSMGVFKNIPGLGTILGTGAGVATEAYLSSIGMATGGYVPATDGGQLHLLGEGGEGEYVIPESKINNMGGTTIVNNFQGYTTEELKRTIDDAMSVQMIDSKFRGGI